MSHSNSTSIPDMINSRINKLEEYKQHLLANVETAKNDPASLAEAKRRLENLEMVLENYKANMKPILDSYNKEEKLGRK